MAYYRDHIIIVLEDEFLSAEITEAATRAPFPTKIGALPGESRESVVQRAKRLVDVYLKGQ